METRATYGSAADIRRECLMPFADGWEQPTPAEVRTVLKMAGLTGSEASALLGVSDGRTVRRWTGGDAPIPFTAWAILCEAAGFGTIWRPAWVTGTQNGQPTSFKYAVSAKNELGIIGDDGQVQPTNRIVSFDAEAMEPGDARDERVRPDPERFQDAEHRRYDAPRRNPPRR